MHKIAEPHRLRTRLAIGSPDLEGDSPLPEEYAIGFEQTD
jgi:hypothetical protein